ncbi:MAG: CRISPR-associated helicase Cas3' [Acidobacteriota bacterium]|jgi:CRISPR-associated endonuclease/helicase Cas3|nr:CRISPR-associated helicase Cas3' [Acidobacteriota bacterium]
MVLFARSVQGKDDLYWQTLDNHLESVASLAKKFSEPFKVGTLGEICGLLHDLGKATIEFQTDVLRKGERGVDHSTCGAQWAEKNLSAGLGRMVGYTVAGHHTGLLDGDHGAKNDGSYRARLEKDIEPVDPSDVPIRIPGSLSIEKDSLNVSSGFQVSMLIRMLFSTLVDADRLDAEAFSHPERSAMRSQWSELSEMKERLFSYLESLISVSKRTLVNRKRQQVLNDCIHAAELPPGLFSLTVPTGGGKTLSSLAFALSHAIRHGMRRVIYVIPYTSIIEQNAAVFRKVLGTDSVLEHHTGFIPTKETETDESKVWEFAVENWDAPLVVTTNVQFFETLFSARPGKCRKLHNIANSVVILDEAQMLPPKLLRPSLEALKELARRYSTSIVLCTATQPAVQQSDDFPGGLEGVREIASDPKELQFALERVAVEQIGKRTDNEIAERMGQLPQVLTITSSRRQAREIFELQNDRNGAFHLSGLMYPAHRTRQITRIRDRLASNKVCRVVSTQLVEAGVDLDFPIVFRAMSGLDSLAQAAGRCNREGKLDKGRLYVFDSEYRSFDSFLARCADTGREVLGSHCEDPLSLEAVKDYFRLLFWKIGEKLDHHRILSQFNAGLARGFFPFREVESVFRLIEQTQSSLIIPAPENEHLIQALRDEPDNIGNIRRIQQYTVSVFDSQMRSLNGVVEYLDPEKERFPLLTNSALYNDHVGLNLNDPTFRNPESNVF